MTNCSGSLKASQGFILTAQALSAFPPILIALICYLCKMQISIHAIGLIVCWFDKNYNFPIAKY